MFHVAWWLMRQEGQLLKTHVPVYVVTMLWWVSAAGGGSIRRVCSLLRASDVRERRSMRSRVRVVWAGGGEGAGEPGTVFLAIGEFDGRPKEYQPTDAK